MFTLCDRIARHRMRQPRDNDVEHNQIELLRTRPLECRCAFRDLLDVEPGERQMETEKLADRCLIFHNQNAAARRGRGDAGNRYR
jgi:hypothetical protein